MGHKVNEGYDIIRSDAEKYFPIIIEAIYSSKSVTEAQRKISKKIGCFLLRESINHFFEKIRKEKGVMLENPSDYVNGKKKIAKNDYDKIVTKEKEDNFKEEPSDHLDIVKIIKSKKALTINEIADKLNCPPRQAEWKIEKAIEAGILGRTEVDKRIFVKEETTTSYARARVVKIEPVNQEIIVGVISDTHFGSKACMPEEIIDFVDTAYKLGVRNIIHCGDFCDGNTVYNGQAAELSIWDVDRQIEFGCSVLPKKEGLKYIMITGNHDLAAKKVVGIDIGKIVSDTRKDINYLGPYRQRIVIPDEKGIDIEMRHTGRPAYALSYSIQKAVESISGGNKPHVLLVGHSHSGIYIPQLRNIHCFQAGCFQGETTLTLRLNLTVNIGGWILRFGIDKTKWIKSLQSQWIGYYQGIKNTGHKAKRIDGWESE